SPSKNIYQSLCVLDSFFKPRGAKADSGIAPRTAILRIGTVFIAIMALRAGFEIVPTATSPGRSGLDVGEIPVDEVASVEVSISEVSISEVSVGQVFVSEVFAGEVSS